MPNYTAVATVTFQVEADAVHEAELIAEEVAQQLEANFNVDGLTVENFEIEPTDEEASELPQRRRG